MAEPSVTALLRRSFGDAVCGRMLLAWDTRHGVAGLHPCS
jgi:hypothetical protein